MILVKPKKSLPNTPKIDGMEKSGMKKAAPLRGVAHSYHSNKIALERPAEAWDKARSTCTVCSIYQLILSQRSNTHFVQSGAGTRIVLMLSRGSQQCGSRERYGVSNKGM